MDQNAMAQVQSALDYVNKDLDRVQSALTTYETQMLKSERVAPQLKEVVTYYRNQTTALRKEMLSLCDLMTAYYKLQLNLKAKEEVVICQPPVIVPRLPVEPEEPAPEVAAEPQNTQELVKELQPTQEPVELTPEDLPM